MSLLFDAYALRAVCHLIVAFDYIKVSQRSKKDHHHSVYDEADDDHDFLEKIAKKTVYLKSASKKTTVEFKINEIHIEAS